MQFLAIDQGNSRTKFGLFQDGELLRVWTAGTQKNAGDSELQQAIFHASEVPSHLPLGLCTVVPELLPAWEQMAFQVGCPLTIFSGQSPTPLRNAYETPETLGADRLLAAVGAARAVGAPVITVSLGTATVVDAVSRERAFLGGLIAPGITSMAEALSTRASALWPASWHEPARAIGATSAEALNNGLFYLNIGGICAMINAVRRELDADAPLALTGGWAQLIAPHLDGVALVDEYLVLRGIAETLMINT